MHNCTCTVFDLICVEKFVLVDPLSSTLGDNRRVRSAQSVVSRRLVPRRNLTVASFRLHTLLESRIRANVIRHRHVSIVVAAHPSGIGSSAGALSGDCGRSLRIRRPRVHRRSLGQKQRQQLLRRGHVLSSVIASRPVPHAQVRGVLEVKVFLCPFDAIPVGRFLDRRWPTCSRLSSAALKSRAARCWTDDGGGEEANGSSKRVEPRCLVRTCCMR